MCLLGNKSRCAKYSPLNKISGMNSFGVGTFVHFLWKRDRQESTYVQKKKAVQAYRSSTYASSENQDMILDRDRQGEN